MRIVTSFFEFETEVKTIIDGYRLRDMGLVSQFSMNGKFYPCEVDELKDFCEHHPKFHIVSYGRNWVMWNRYHPEGYLYRLAEGNPDPNFMLDYRVEAEEQWEDWLANGFRLPER